MTRFTERVFAEDRMAVEAEQRALGRAGQGLEPGVFPLFLEVRDVLRSNGVPIHPGRHLRIRFNLALAHLLGGSSSTSRRGSPHPASTD